jgi:hypothetical protein
LRIRLAAEERLSPFDFGPFDSASTSSASLRSLRSDDTAEISASFDCATHCVLRFAQDDTTEISASFDCAREVYPEEKY